MTSFEARIRVLQEIARKTHANVPRHGRVRRNYARALRRRQRLADAYARGDFQAESKLRRHLFFARENSKTFMSPGRFMRAMTPPPHVRVCEWTWKTKASAS